MNRSDIDNKLESIIGRIRNYLGENYESIDPNEQINIPNIDQYSGYTSNYFQIIKDKNTLNVDSFLYSEDDLDVLVDEGKLFRNICLECSSVNIEPLRIFYL